MNPRRMVLRDTPENRIAAIRKCKNIESAMSCKDFAYRYFCKQASRIVETYRSRTKRSIVDADYSELLVLRTIIYLYQNTGDFFYHDFDLINRDIPSVRESTEKEISEIKARGYRNLKN